MSLPRASFATAASLDVEWLVTNGLGGYAAGTAALVNTRRYHGLLVAALHPPVDRRLLLAALMPEVSYRGRVHALGGAEYADGTLAPAGHRLLESFHIEDGLPVWCWRIADALLQLRVFMHHGANTSYAQFALLAAAEPLQLRLLPLVSCRDYHAHWRGAGAPRVEGRDGLVDVRMYDTAPALRLALEGGAFHGGADWYWNFRHRVEAERGLDAHEDLFCPGRFEASLRAGEATALVASAGAEQTPPATRVLAELRARSSDLRQRIGDEDPVAQSLVLAADAFLVARGAPAPGVTGGTTIIAGYPWFGDWGRDTMIALPGLTLATGRAALARDVLLTFARHVSDGMLPNRFPDGGEQPEYNTVDATLWYFQAIRAYLQATGDRSLLAELYPVLADIVAWHRRGTRHGIRVDAGDGLLRAGEPGVQLTWMDAKVSEHVITPRIGKPVEVNALWIGALAAMTDWARQLGDRDAARDHAAAAAQAGAAFRARFWNARSGHLYDVVDGPDGADASLRPNQLFAVSLGLDLLPPAQARAVVDSCARELLTPVGLRSLSPLHPDYIGRYAGGPAERDAAYHQGTVWSWLAGPYALAQARTRGDPRAARRVLEGLLPHLDEGCLGTVAEIFDGDAPHAPRGCCAQAWSVGELLRAWRRLSADIAADSGETAASTATHATRAAGGHA